VGVVKEGCEGEEKRGDGVRWGVEDGRQGKTWLRGGGWRKKVSRGEGGSSGGGRGEGVEKFLLDEPKPDRTWCRCRCARRKCGSYLLKRNRRCDHERAGRRHAGRVCEDRSGQGRRWHTAFLVEKGMRGFSVGRKLDSWAFSDLTRRAGCSDARCRPKTCWAESTGRPPF